ncbi:MAG: hypothetical protein JNJ88_06845 [Planctomycetes bacterium]|nr:hypothetical protein [Planctomycetota bacterium]
MDTTRAAAWPSLEATELGYIVKASGFSVLAMSRYSTWLVITEKDDVAQRVRLVEVFAE